jgi:hypothetical protein
MPALTKSGRERCQLGKDRLEAWRQHRPQGYGPTAHPVIARFATRSRRTGSPTSCHKR